MHTQAKKIIITAWLGLLMMNLTSSMHAAPLPAQRPVPAQANQAPLECTLPMENLKEILKSKFKASGDLDLSTEFFKLTGAMELQFQEFIDLSIHKAPRPLLSAMKQLLENFKQKLLITLAHRVEESGLEKLKNDRKCLLAILTVIHHDFVCVCTTLENYNGSTNPLKLLELGSAIKPYKIRLPKKFRDYSIFQWRDAIIHRYSCTAELDVTVESKEYDE